MTCEFCFPINDAAAHHRFGRRHPQEDADNFHRQRDRVPLRLPNGNTLICDGAHGSLFEVTFDKKIVWLYTNEFPIPTRNEVPSALRYAPDYPGLLL